MCCSRSRPWESLRDQSKLTPDKFPSGHKCRGVGLSNRIHRGNNSPLPQKDAQPTSRGYAYYGVTGNSESMNRFRQEVENRWRKWLFDTGHESTDGSEEDADTCHAYLVLQEAFDGLIRRHTIPGSLALVNSACVGRARFFRSIQPSRPGRFVAKCTLFVAPAGDDVRS